MTDRELLTSYAATGSQEAFGELVGRHADKVYSTCRRVLGDGHAAEDASQAVFLVLARKARDLSPRTVISGWLFLAARKSALSLRKKLGCRARHELEAATMRRRTEKTTEKALWNRVEPRLDDLLAGLPRRQREAVVLYYLDGKSRPEVAREMACPQSTVSTLVSRGLDRLRAKLSRQKVAVPAVVLAGFLGEQAVVPAPASLAASVQAAAFGQAAASPAAASLAGGMVKAMALAKVKVAAAVLVGATVIAAGVPAAVNALSDPGGGAVLPAPAAAAAAGEADAGNAVLSGTGYWRFRILRGTDLVRTDADKLVHLDELRPAPRGKGGKTLNKAAGPKQAPAPPPAGWTKADFDDSSWPRVQGPFDDLRAGASLLCLRGRFKVESPADPTLALTFRGGAVVYVNGREVARSGLPTGKLEPGTPAKDYPKESFVDGADKPLRRETKRTGKQKNGRDRRISAVKIPASALRKGVNVLAVEVHRAPAREVMYTHKASRSKSHWWPRLALRELRLAAPGGAKIIPNLARPKGLQVWAHPLARRVTVSDYGDPNEPLPSVRIVAPRNGFSSGQVVVGSTSVLRGLKAAATELKGQAGTIPASAVTIRYALLDGRARGKEAAYFDGLDEAAPAEVPVHTAGKAALQPVWISVKVPKTAKPGKYLGKVTLSATGARPVEVSVKLTVAKFVLPDPTDFVTHVDLIQSPESLAIKYNVPMWSEKHWTLIEKSFELMGQLGNKTVYIPLIRRTHFGNEHTMVRWIKNGNGKYTYDFSIAEKYLDLAVKHMGKVPVVCLYCWEYFTGSRFFQNWPGKRDPFAAQGMLFTLKDPATGKLTEAVGPKWGTPACREFWKPVMAGMKKLLDKHGLGKSMTLGISTDWRPTKDVVEDLAAAAPGAPWVLQNHSWTNKLHGQPVTYVASVWGMASYANIPKFRHLSYGWRNRYRAANFPRGRLWYKRHLSQHRLYPESCLRERGKFDRKSVPGGTATGFGRVGADFWRVLKDKRGRNRGIVAGRYPESSFRGVNLGITSTTPFVLSPGKNGPVATTRFEMFRENLQELQARLLIEDAFTVPELKAKIGEALAKRCFDLVEERTFTVMRLRIGLGANDPSWKWLLSSGLQDRSEKLYDLAAEVAAKLSRK